MSTKNFGHLGGTCGDQVHRCARSHFVIATHPTCLMRKVTNFKFAVTQNEVRPTCSTWRTLAARENR